MPRIKKNRKKNHYHDKQKDKGTKEVSREEILNQDISRNGWNGVASRDIWEDMRIDVAV